MFVKSLLRFLSRWIRRIFGMRPRRPANPLGAVTNVQVIIDMTDVTITWDLPTAREKGGVVTPADIKNVEVLISADLGANFASLNTVGPAEVQSAFIPDIEPGDWIVRHAVTEINDQPGLTLDTPFVVADTSPIGTVQNVNISFS